MDLHIVRTILHNEFREAVRNRWFVLCAAIFGVLALALSYLGLSGLGTFGVAGFGRTAASLLHLIMVIVPLMGLLIGALSVAGEREHGTLLTLLAQPVTPTEVLLGKFAGSASALTASLLIGFGASGAVIARYGGMSHVGGYAALVLFTLLLGLAHVAIGFCVSVVTRRASTALGLALGCWLVLVFLSDLGLMGTAMVLRLAPGELLWASLANPSQAFKLGVLQAMHGTVDVLGPSGRYAADVLGQRLLPVMAALLAAWILVPMGVALRIFTRRGAV
jgi:Cu-processing system permease protein